ncbi:MAG: hypothetical protein AAGC55_05665 [Myxococcota bacterium]
MQRIWRTLLPAAALAAMFTAAGIIYAQPEGGGGSGDAGNGDDPPAGTDREVTVPMEKYADLPPRAMLEQSESLIGEMKGMLDRVIAIQQVARKQKDVIRLNCVNDRLIQVKKLLNIAESARNNLVEAIAAENKNERFHQFSKVTISHENVSVLRDEAEACVGEELIFLGPTAVEVDRPVIIDDPTKENPFDYDPAVGMERPAFATPFL